MTDHLLRLNDCDLGELVGALRSGRLDAPFSAIGVQRFVSAADASFVAADLQSLVEHEFTATQMAFAIEMAANARRQRHVMEDVVELVTTGPPAPSVVNRDTGVVVRDLFAHARKSVLIAGYAIYQGQQVFQTLANRMMELPELEVRMFLDVPRAAGDTSMPSEITHRFADRFRKKQWPENSRLPMVFYDPRALATEANKKACLHAKCIVIDRSDLFVSSANFTEAAQERNLEIGVLIHSSTLADRVAAHFDALLDAALLVQLL